MVRLISVLWFHIWINWEATRHPILQSVFHSIQIWVVEKIKSYQMLSDCYNAIDTKFVCKIIQFHLKYLSETRNKWTRYFNEFKIYTTNNAGWFELSIKSSLESNFDPFQSNVGRVSLSLRDVNLMQILRPLIGQTDPSSPLIGHIITHSSRTVCCMHEILSLGRYSPSLTGPPPPPWVTGHQTGPTHRGAGETLATEAQLCADTRGVNTWPGGSHNVMWVTHNDNHDTDTDSGDVPGAGQSDQACAKWQIHPGWHFYLCEDHGAISRGQTEASAGHLGQPRAGLHLGV